ncbi:DUF2065 domain-containing protein [Cochlodiniinecator piscidefendens]|uniref:DUF2065 domain-containing protein n=1 Tax=Cochlodiniinecator piscidefendens TaxID=2715756 RepID=UPI00140B2BC5|nr:DUF2065 domain-containing protein [Cochlodiniinecator piscidefendens]
MIATVLYAIGLVLAVEGLVLALAPSRLENIIEMLNSLSHDTRRIAGLLGIGCAILLIWFAKSLGA